MTAPPLARRSTTGGREYVHPLTGLAVPSVTTVLKALDRPALVQWAANMAANYAVENWAKLAELATDAERISLIKMAHRRESTRAANLGTAVHDAVDAWCTSRPMPSWEPGVAPYMDQFLGFLEAYEPEFIQNEFTVWSHRHGYAGTGDAIARINGWVTLLDTKTGKGCYPETGLQLAALAGADCILHPDGREEPLPTVDRLAILHLRPQSWGLIPVNPGIDTFDAFVGALQVTRWLGGTAPTVLGPKLTGDA